MNSNKTLEEKKLGDKYIMIPWAILKTTAHKIFGVWLLTTHLANQHERYSSDELINDVLLCVDSALLADQQKLIFISFEQRLTAVLRIY